MNAVESSRRGGKKGREAMAYAIENPEGGSLCTKRHALECPGFSYMLLYQSRVVLRHSRSLAERVLNGSISLNVAFLEVRPGPPKPPRPARAPKPKRSVDVKALIEKARSDFTTSVMTGSRYW